MYHDQLDSLETKVYAITDDYQYKEVLDLKSGFQVRPKPFKLVLKQNNGKTTSYFDNGFYAHSKYTFYDESLNVTNVNFSNWILRSIDEQKKRGRSVIYTISDPLGKFRTFSNLELDPSWGKYFQIDGICNIIKMLREISVFPDWTYFDLKQENISLKKQIDYLTSKINK